jgi:hypothetical protein
VEREDLIRVSLSHRHRCADAIGGRTARRLLERGSNASGFVAIKALLVSCAIDDEEPTSHYFTNRQALA